MQYRDFFGDCEHHLHVVLGEEQRQPALAGDVLQKPHRVVGFGYYPENFHRGLPGPRSAEAAGDVVVPPCDELITATLCG